MISIQKQYGYYRYHLTPQSLLEYFQLCCEYICVCREYNPKYLYILTNINIDQNPILFIFHKISLGYLYYQFLTAIRKDTKK